jgi:hypothetical protein
MTERAAGTFHAELPVDEPQEGGSRGISVHSASPW